MPGDKKSGANREAKTEQNTVKPKQVNVKQLILRKTEIHHHWRIKYIITNLKQRLINCNFILMEFRIVCQ